MSRAGVLAELAACIGGANRAAAVTPPPPVLDNEDPDRSRLHTAVSGRS